MDETQEPDPVTPVSAIDRYFDEYFALDRFVELCHGGLRQAAEATGYVDIAERVAKFRKKPSPFRDEKDKEEAFRRAQKLEAFAKQERAEGFPYLYGMATIRLWTILESAVDDAVAAQLKTNPLDKFPVLARIKGGLVEFMRASEDERIETLLEKLKSTTDAPLKKGAGRFESLLDAVALSGALPESHRKVLLEFSEVRNVLVHRNSVADKRFRDACPWLGASLGSRLRLTHADYVLYGSAVIAYLVDICCRCCAEGDADSESALDTVRLRDSYRAKIAVLLKAREKSADAEPDPGTPSVN